MLLMETIFKDLKEYDLVNNAEEFSTDWCSRSRSWFAVQKNKGRDFSVPVAISLLGYIKMRRTMLILKRRQLGSILDGEINLLTSVIDCLDEYLLNAHQIAAVAETKPLQQKMLGNS
jgi:hypothetical protein